VGPNYVIMEYLKGPNLKDYLKGKQDIPESITEQIIMIRKELKRVGFIRIKTSIGYFVVTKGNVLKAIDHSDGLTMNDPYNPKMFRDLKKLGLLDTFLKQAKKIDPESYEEWQEKYRLQCDINENMRKWCLKDVKRANIAKNPF